MSQEQIHTREKLQRPNYALRRFALGVFGVIVIGGGIAGSIAATSENQVIARSVFSIPQGERGIQEPAEDSIYRMADESGIDRDKIRHDEIVYDSQIADKEAGGVVHPGDEFEAEITKRDFPGASYHVEISPVDSTTETSEDN
jgi:hypothetical protein